MAHLPDPGRDTTTRIGATFHVGSAVRATGIAMLSMLALLSVILVAEHYSADRAKAAISAHRAAHVVSTQFGWMFEASAHALRRIEDTVNPDGPRARDGGVISLGAAVSDLPSDFHYSVYDSQGRLTHSSLTSPPRTQVGDRDYFHRLKAGEELVIAPMLTERQSGEQVFVIGRRLDKAGTFNGIATIAIPVQRLQSLAETLGFGGQSTVGLIGLDGILIARAPPIDPINLSGWVLFDKLAQAPDGSYETASPADGIERIVGYWKMEHWPVVAIAGLDRGAAMQGFWRNVGLAAVLALPILFGVGWLVYDLVQLMRQDERRQRELTAANERSSFLLREIHHRVKNNLQTVSSLIRLEKLPSEVKTSLLGRIAAMVEVHEAMYRSDQFEEICIQPYLDRLVENVAKGYGLNVDVRLDIAQIRIAGERAMLLGLLANELVSNSFKHAFAPRGGGRLDVRMTERPDGMLRLCVSDDGPGFTQEEDRQQMGSRLIDAFAAQLGGTVSVESEGRTITTVDFPREYGPSAPPAEPVPDQPRPAQDRSIVGVRSRKSIRLSR